MAKPLPPRLESLSKQILSLFPDSAFQYGFHEIADLVGIFQKEDKIDLSLVIQQLLKSRKIQEYPNGKFGLPIQETRNRGKVDFVNPRFAYIRMEAEDVFAHAENLRGAQDGDLVEVELFYSGRGRKKEAEVLRIVERARQHYVGKIRIKGSTGWLVSDYRKMHEEIMVPEYALNGAKSGEKVYVEIKSWGNSHQAPVGEVKEILGAPGENEAEMHGILADYNIPLRFDAEVEKAAEAIPNSIDESEIQNRRDFRSITTFTIDPFDAKDFDDALSIQEIENGSWEVGIHIADVSHYVQPGSVLDQAALERATSVYLVDRVSPMLPEHLSNNLCSLRPHEDRLTFSCVVQITEKGKLTAAPWIGRTVIHSDHRFTYEEVQEILDGAEGPFQKELHLLNQMALSLREARLKSGAMSFESTEVKFELNDQGVPLRVIPKIRKDAHKLIEEFMLLANKKVAEYAFHFQGGKAENPMVYRVHEPPNPERLKTFADFAGKFGYKIKTEDHQIADSLNKMVSELEGRPEQELMQNLAIRVMAKARYTTKPLGHFGLAFSHYSHFTSPIRRYPDVLTHRLLWAYLQQEPRMPKEPLEKLCMHCSDKERIAAEAERASIKYKQVEFMTLQDPARVFEAVISGVTEWGIYVDIIENRCEGLVRISDLSGDVFDYKEEDYCLIARRSGQKLTFGDRVKVQLKAANMEKRTIDFFLIEPDLSRKLSVSFSDKKLRQRGAKSSGRRKR